MKEIQEKYSSKDQKTQQKLQQETMALFPKTWCESIGGMFPIFVQMPILIGFYHAITENTRNYNNMQFLMV